MGSLRLFLLLAGIWLQLSPPFLFADEPIVVHGGLSPNSKLSVVISKDNNWDSSGPEWPAPSAGELDISKVYLYDAINQKVIGPLEEVNTTAGGFGTSLSNVKVLWSADSQFVALSFRSGRLNNSIVVYRILPFKSTSRAVPQKLPLADTGPNGKEIFSHLSQRANGGIGLEKWLGPNEFEAIQYGFMLPNPPGIAGNYFNDDGQIGIVYSYSGDQWKVKRFLKPAIPAPSSFSSARHPLSPLDQLPEMFP